MSRRRPLVILGLAVAALALMTTGHRDVAQPVLLAMVLTYTLPSLPAQREVLRRWVGEEPMFPAPRGKHRVR